ncbi:protein usg [Devosia sp. Root413D1]|uniref:protein usg n=1 Tax=unclassified Devosia TaxID=196773 RepID=UPI0006F55C20|nr:MULTISPECIES: protein usg [unclassified Devosia]KQU95889.1 protein usg [Devosia sp. Root105]KQW78259.1 protein usg [Devosia sp. Root413D1]
MSPLTCLDADTEGFGLTTAQIIYRVPDHLELLQDFVWQQYDVFPQFPSLRKFLAFWEEKIEGPLHSVTVAHARLIYPVELRTLKGARLH